METSIIRNYEESSQPKTIKHSDGVTHFKSESESRPTKNSSYMKLGSISPLPARPRLKRTLRRDVSFYPIHEDHLKHYWAAYRLGAFENLDSQLSQEDFLDQISQIDDDSSGIHTLKVNDVPVGAVVIYGGPYRVEPHCIWFPWATPRNKLESAVHFLNEIRKEYLAMIFSEKEDSRFFTHICKYGILRRGCKVIGFYEDSDAMLFYSNKK